LTCWSRVNLRHLNSQTVKCPIFLSQVQYAVRKCQQESPHSVWNFWHWEEEIRWSITQVVLSIAEMMWAITRVVKCMHLIINVPGAPLTRTISEKFHFRLCSTCYTKQIIYLRFARNPYLALVLTNWELSTPSEETRQYGSSFGVWVNKRSFVPEFQVASW